MNFVTKIWKRLFNRDYVNISSVEQWKSRGIIPYFNSHEKIKNEVGEKE